MSTRHGLHQKLPLFPGSASCAQRDPQKPRALTCKLPGKAPCCSSTAKRLHIYSECFLPLVFALSTLLVLYFCRSEISRTLLASYNHHSLNSDTCALPILFLTPATPHPCNIAAMHFIIKIDFASYSVNYFL